MSRILRVIDRNLARNLKEISSQHGRADDLFLSRCSRKVNTVRLSSTSVPAHRLLGRDLTRVSRQNRGMTSTGQVHNERQKDVTEIAKKIKLVIFDKDGTLTKYGTGWDMIGVSRRLEKEANIPGLSEKLLRLWGYNTNTKTWQDGIFNDSPSEIIHRMTEFLKCQGVPETLAKEMSETCYGPDSLDESLIEAIDDPIEIMTKLKEKGIKIAIATNDSAPSTDVALSAIKLKPFVDLVLCGGDADAKAKPDPHNLIFICQKLGVALGETLYIGDSPRDVEMGVKAAVGLNVGVLSGLAQEEDLKEADVILKSVKDILPMIFPETKVVP